MLEPIRNPHIRDTITVAAAFNQRLAAFGGAGPVYLVARVVDLATDLNIGAHSVVIVADELRGNGHLINGVDAKPVADGGPGKHAGPTPPSGGGGPGGDGGHGGAGSRGGTVTVMCRRSSSVRISMAGTNGGAGGPGGNGGPGSAATSIPGGTITETQFDQDGNPFEVEVPLPDIEVPGTLGGLGGVGGAGGAGGDGGVVRFTSIVDDTAPVLDAAGGMGGPGGAGGLSGPHGAFAEVPADLDVSPVAGERGADGTVGIVSVASVSEEEYVAGLRPLLDAVGAFADLWAAHRLLVGQYFYRQFRPSDPSTGRRIEPSKGQQAATEFTRVLELQPDNEEALRWWHQLMDLPRPLAVGPALVWEPGGLNALGLPRDLDVRPRFDAYSAAFASFGSLVVSFLQTGQLVLVEQKDLDVWRSFLAHQTSQAEAAHETTLEDRDQAQTEARLAADAMASVQARLDQTTLDIQAALEEMRTEPLTIGDIVGTVAEVAAAVVAVVAAVPSGGASLVALAPAMASLSSAVLDNAEPVAKALLAGDKANTDQIKAAYKDVDSTSADVVKGAKAIVSFVEVVKKLTAASTPDNSKHVALVRHGVELTHEMLLARHRITQAGQRLRAAHARVARADTAVAGIKAVVSSLTPTEEALRSTGLHAVAIAESKADALLTLAFYAQRSLEIYTLTDHEDAVPLETGHLHPDIARAYDEKEFGEVQLVQRLNDSWSGLLGLLNLQVKFTQFVSLFHEPDTRRLSFPAGGPELESLRARRRFAFRIDVGRLPPGQADAKVVGVRVALVGATHPAGALTCEIRHGSSYETRRHDGSIRVDLLQPRTSNREATLQRLIPGEGSGPDPLLTDPQSIAFWGRGMGGDWELSIPDHEFAAGLDLTGLTEVQIWIRYSFLKDPAGPTTGPP